MVYTITPLTRLEVIRKMTSKTNMQNGITRKGFLAGIGASAMAKWGMAAELVTDWRRTDIAYEDFSDHKLDRKMLELLRRY